MHGTQCGLCDRSTDGGGITADVSRELMRSDEVQAKLRVFLCALYC